MSCEAVARFLSRLDDPRRDEVENDVGPLRGLTLEQRGKIVESVCRDAMAIRALVETVGEHDYRVARWDELMHPVRVP